MNALVQPAQSQGARQEGLAAPAPPPVRPTWTTGSTAAIKTGTWRAALPQHIHAPSPCHAACPVGGDIAEWIGQARAGDFAAAWQTLARHNPLPAVIGRICHHPCETVCNRVGVDGALSICKLERFVGDLALDSGWRFPAVASDRHERVAVVGGGPSGLSAAYQLRRRGYAVTILEAQPALGGLLRDGIPGYRLARAVLDAEIARILALGIEVRCGQALDAPAALAALRTEFDAVYLAYGARRTKRLAQLDYSQPWVLDGAAYLARGNQGAAPALGPRVLVVGGGSAALDAARSARRAGHDVTILALEAEHDMPAQREEVVEALEEGITLVDGAMLQAAAMAAGGLRLDCVRVQLQRGADKTAFTVTQQAGSGFVLRADAIITSIGQDPELGALAPEFALRGPLLGIDDQGATGVDRVWAGGDLASNARFVSEAIAMGERGALAIDRRLRLDAGQAATSADSPDPAEPNVALAAINQHYHPWAERAAAPHLAVAERLAQGGEVQQGLAMAQALAEAARCYSCGTCTHCDNCVSYCPDMAVQRFGAGYRVLGDYCKGCGLCVKECPSGSMKMVEELR